MTPPPNDQESATSTSYGPTSHDTRQFVDGKLDTIREILVGDDLNNLQERFEALEKSVEGRYTRIHNELMAECEALQAHGEADVKELGDRVVEMIGQLQAEDRANTSRMESMEARLASIETQVESTKSELFEQIHEIHEEISNELSKFSKIISRQQEESRQAVSRADFAKILNGLAGRLVPQEFESHERA